MFISITYKDHKFIVSSYYLWTFQLNVHIEEHYWGIDNSVSRDLRHYWSVFTPICRGHGCESICEKKSEKVWKWGFVKSKNVWNQIKSKLSHPCICHTLFVCLQNEYREKTGVCDHSSLNDTEKKNHIEPISSVVALPLNHWEVENSRV